MKIDERTLFNEGFSEYDPYCFDYATKCYEKRYDLKEGSYFLSIKKYDPLYKRGREISPEHFEAYAKLHKYGTHEHIELTFDFKTLDEVNEFIQKMFEAKLVESCNL